ncbi:hypothetical protein ACFVJI_21595 [Streptomyces sp. NPDC127584]|uniref:hypothetical protein n=1 Tax=Streptomyces sp. NPDC127584 TaxID=3345403 RepID=UPI003636EFB7
MTNGAAGAGADSDEAEAWHERLGWAFGLIADDPAEREAALARLDWARRNAWAALDRYNELWHLTRSLGPEEQYQEAAFKRAREVYADMRGQTLPEGLWGGQGAGGPCLPYALLFLEWEARFPREWTEHAKAWGTKQSLIRSMAVADHDQPTRAKLIDLVEIVVQRAHRCKDREYARVARAVDGEDLRHRLSTAVTSDNPWARLHAGYVLWLLDHPEVPNTRPVWRAWVTETAGSSLAPAISSGLPSPITPGVPGRGAQHDGP